MYPRDTHPVHDGTYLPDTTCGGRRGHLGYTTVTDTRVRYRYLGTYIAGARSS